MVTYIVARTHTIYFGTRGTYFRPNAYVFRPVKFISCIFCRRQQYVPKFVAYIVASLCTLFHPDN